MAEDLTTYTEVDPDSKLTVTAAKVAAAGLERGVSSYVYKDKGAAHFNGDFEHKCEITCASVSGLGIMYPWALANAINDINSIDVAGGDALLAWDLYGTNIRIGEVVAGTRYDDEYTLAGTGTKYYLRIKRDESVGTYGTLYCYIATGNYDDEGGTLEDTLALGLHEKEDFRYAYAASSYGAGTGTFTGDAENLDLQEGAPPATHNARLLDGLLDGGSLIGGKLVR